LGQKLKIWAERPAVAAGFKEKERERGEVGLGRKERERRGFEVGLGLWVSFFLFILFQHTSTKNKSNQNNATHIHHFI
jgi:hypothetical protein